MIIRLIARSSFRSSVQATSDEMIPPPPLPTAGMVKTWWCQPIDQLGLLLMSAVFVSFGLAAATESGGDPAERLSPSLLIGNIVIFAILVIVVASIVIWRVSLTNWLGLAWRKWPHAIWIAPTATILMWTIIGSLNAAGLIAWLEKIVGGSSTQDAVALLRDGSDATSVALMAFSAAIVAPIAEEVIFRGYIYPVAKWLSNRGAAVFFSALLFSACHGNVPLVLPLFLLGLLLALVYEWTGSIWAPISIHFFFNSATVAIQLALRAGLIPDAPTT
jgi:membrane protease YdiL (CAAX protease family)